MASSLRQQALIEAPIEEVWELLSDPSRFPEWSYPTIEVTGVPTQVEKGSTFRNTSRGPLGMKNTTIFEVAELDELREIKLRCQTSGYYSHWVLTEARGDTFAELEYGVEPQGLQQRAIGATITKGAIRRYVDQSLDGIRRLLTRE
jgi:uncharacterized protein YndB with AHSA1/START domain